MDNNNMPKSPDALVAQRWRKRMLLRSQYIRAGFSYSIKTYPGICTHSKGPTTSAQPKLCKACICPAQEILPLLLSYINIMRAIK